MLSDLEAGQFRTFGFTVLRSCLDESEVRNLQEAHDRVIARAPAYDYFAGNGTRMLSPFVQADDAFARLIEHPRLMEAMRDIWGTECLYTAASDMWANRDDTPWHTDGQPGRQAVTLKTAVYLDEQDRGLGSLNLSEEQPFVYSREMLQKGGAGREKMAARLEELGVERVREG